MDNETKEITTKKGEFLLIRNFTGFFGILTSVFYFFQLLLMYLLVMILILE